MSYSKGIFSVPIGREGTQKETSKISRKHPPILSLMYKSRETSNVKIAPVLPILNFSTTIHLT